MPAIVGQEQVKLKPLACKWYASNRTFASGI
jgi:hypothetical protein